ncbi:MAG: RNA polymerase sigma factor [Gammaproteobacteria bacterium]|nr:RNA polymerase sigma factor [Gammaproteobacteria bacterium]MDE2249999.1 RNA polymerase sigma factor [Gammaproteobacteria bacterium]
MQQIALSDAGQRDRDIVELLQGGSHEVAFNRLLERYERKVYRLCCSLMRDADQAADVAQESLLRIWKGLPGYDQRASLSTWIYTITRNRCLSAIERRREAVSLSDPAVEQAAEAATATAPEAGRDHLDLLRGLVEALPERYRQALTLYYYEEKSVAEVAAMLGQAEGTIKTNLHRARALLSERVRELGLGDPSLWLEEAA